MDDANIYFDIQCIIMTTKNSLRFMKDPVEPEKIVEIVQVCFGELATHVPKISNAQLRRRFRRKCKEVANVTDKAISDAVDGSWHCNIQSILDALTDIVELIVPAVSSSEDEIEEVDAHVPVEDSYGFVHEKAKPHTRTRHVTDEASKSTVTEPIDENYETNMTQVESYEATNKPNDTSVPAFGYVPKDTKRSNSSSGSAYGYLGRSRMIRTK